MSKKIRYNKSKTYLLPLLSECIDINPKFFSYLKQTYINDDIGMYENCFYILHNFSFRNPEFTLYENSLIKNNYFVDYIDINSDQVLYIFRFPEEYLHEYEMFKQGKYSKYGPDAKELILSFFTKVYENNVSAVNFLIKVKQVLFKDQKLREKLEKELSTEKHKVTIDKEAELSDIPEKEHETFIISKHIDGDRLMNKKNMLL